MKNFLFFLLILTLIASCKEATTDNSETTNNQSDSTAVAASPANADSAAVKTGINLEPFSSLPFKPDGCSCSFSLNEAEFKSSKFVYADDSQNAAYLNLNGTITQLAKKSESLNGGRLVKVFANDQFEVTINVLKVGELDKTTQYKGSMTFKPKKGESKNSFIYGECRC